MDPIKKLEFIESLSEEEAYRYKYFVSTGISPEFLEALANPMIPPMISKEHREEIFLALSVAAKSFAIDLCETALAIKANAKESIMKSSIEEMNEGEPEKEGKQTPLLPGHLLEAYRRLSLENKILGAPESTVPDITHIISSAATEETSGLSQTKKRKVVDVSSDSDSRGRYSKSTASEAHADQDKASTTPEDN